MQPHRQQPTGEDGRIIKDKKNIVVCGLSALCRCLLPANNWYFFFKWHCIVA